MGLHIGAVALAFVSLALTCVSMAFSMNDVGFVKLKLSSTTEDFYGIVGFNNLCSTTDGGTNFTCSSIEIQSTCTSLDVVRNRWMGIQVSIVGGAILSLAIVFTVVGNTKPIALARVLIALFAFLSYAAVGTFVYLFFYNWIACDGDLCTLYTAFTGFCEQSFQWPWWLMVSAGGLSLITFILSIVAFVSAEDPAASPAQAQNTQQQQPQQQQQQPLGSNEPVNETQQDGAQQDDAEQQDAGDEDYDDAKKDQQDDQGEQQEEEDNLTKKEAYDSGNPEDDDEGLYPLPEDGGPWTYDDESGMYWSDDQQMYFHRESGQYYDYQTDMWYSEETGQWYKADE